MNVLVTGGLGFIGSNVVLQLLKKDISVIVADLENKKNKEKLLNKIGKIGKKTNAVTFEQLDITNFENLENIFSSYTIDSVINLAYGIGAICEEQPLLASKINIVGTTSVFDMVVKHNIRRLVFASSETVYGEKQSIFGQRAVTEEDYTGINNHFFTYGVMKLLNEFMAEKYIQKHGCSIVYTRPSVVFGYGRQNTALNWAEEFASKPALGHAVDLPFSKNNKDNWIYVEDCAEQLVRLCLKDKVNFSCFNTGSQTVDGYELEETVKKIIPDAQLNFLKEQSFTPLIDNQDDSRIRKEINFHPRSFAEGVECLIKEARENQ